jgi:ABC-2 type transport system permease protein
MILVRALGLYLRLLGVQFRSQVHYRSSFLFDVLTTSITSILGFVSLVLVIQRFGNIGGWELAEVAFLYGMVEGAFGVMDLVFSGFDAINFGRRVRLGQLDQMLLRPVSITLQVFGSDFALRRFGRISQGLLILVLAISWLEIEWTFLKVVYLPIVFVSLVLFFGGLFIIGATITFWTIDSIEVMNIFTYGGSEMMSYPMHIYSSGMRKFFTYIIPAIFLNYYPALYFLDKPDPFNFQPAGYFLAPVIGVGVLIAGMAFWTFGLRQYQSTGT